MKADCSVNLELPRIPMEVFAPLLGSGVGVPITIGIALDTFLQAQLRFDPAYIETRIQTILLNSHPVDRLDTTALNDGDIIALSAAMPGLAGAILRKGGVLAAMRAAISQAPVAAKENRSTTGVVRLKLFNMVAREMGPKILHRGIWLRGDQWRSVADQLDTGSAFEAGNRDWVEVRVSLAPA